MGNLQLSPGGLFANRFEIQHAAGSGGMGTVYRATDRYSGDTVALKLLHTSQGGPEEGERFAREAQLLSELRHPGIVSYVAHGQTPDGQRYLAMEWIDGEDLGERLARGPLSIRDSVRLLEQVADALSAAHQRGIIHRDLKPTNLFLVGGDVGRVKILDFGIARRVASSQAMTRTGMVIGTPEYMAPEQARGIRDLTPAADLFSLGCVLYECLTGQPPFVADHITVVLVRILFEEPIPVEERRPGVSQSLSDLVRRLLAKDSRQRVADAATLRAELLGLGELPEPALAPTMVGQKPKSESFAEQEQSLLSIVLAAQAEQDMGFGATQPGSRAQLAATDKWALLQDLTALGGSPDFLANGTLVVTVLSIGSAQDQATVAARAALLIKERWPDAMVSMATGRGAVRGRTAVGDVVEAAAQSLKTGSHAPVGAPPSGVLLDPLSAKLLTGRFSQTPQPNGALLIHEEREADASRPLLGKPTPCVGRETELATLDAQLTGCIEDSEARLVLMTAPPGVGKSRLRHEFLRRVEKRSEPITVLLGRGDMMGAGTPYGILRSAIHKLCGLSGSESLKTQQDRLRMRIARHLAEADAERVVLFLGELCNVPFPEEGKPMLQAARLDPRLMRDGLRRALRDFLVAECTSGPLLLVLDDLQWGDALTVSLLDEALRELSGAPLLIVSFARPEVHEVFPKLWQSHKMQELPLKGLSKKACERLIVQVLGKDVAPDSVARAIEQAAGNALFLEELIRSIAEGNPEVQSETVVAMLQARIGRLESSVRRAVRAASVFGQTFWRSGVAALLGISPTAPEAENVLAVLVEAELIYPQPQSRLEKQSEYGFRHALVRDAAYSLLTDNDLKTGHRLAAEFLVAAGETHAASIAEHFELGHDKERAAAYYLRACDLDARRGNAASARRSFEHGISCTSNEELLGQFHGAVCILAFTTQKFSDAIESAAIALKLAPVGSVAWCSAAIISMFAAMSRQDGARLLELLFLFLNTNPSADAEADYLEACIGIGLPISWAGPLSLLQIIHQRLIDGVARIGQKNPTVRRSLHIFRFTLYCNREPKPWSAIHEAEQGLLLARQLGENELADAYLVACMPWGWIDLGDHEGVLQRGNAIKEMALKSQNAQVRDSWLLTMAACLVEFQEEAAWSQAEQLLEDLRKQPAGYPIIPAMTQGFSARISLQRGHLDKAEETSRAAMSMFQSMPMPYMPAAAVYMESLTRLGRAQEAISVAEQVLGTLSMLGGMGAFEVAVRLAAAESFFASGDLERAQTELRETLRQIQLRADDITDPFWKNSYLTRNQHCVRAQKLARERGLNVVITL